MGIKLLILRMIPWWFPMMGNTTACHQQSTPSSPAATTGGGGGDGKASKHSVKLIMADGTVEVYHRPVSAAELMIGHPMHLVCRSDAFTIGERIPALAEGEQLQLGHAYFLLPAHFFQSVLSFVTLASSIALLQQRPFDVRKTPSGSLQIRVSDEFIGKMEEEEVTQQGDGGGGGRVCTTAALEKDYRQLVAGSRARQWKPKLETIRESERWRGRLVAVGGAAAALGDIGRRRNKEREKQQQQQQQQRQQQKQQEQRRRQQKQLKLRQQEEEEEPKVPTVSQLLGSPHPPKEQGDREGGSL